MSARVNYATLIFPPPRSPAYEARSFSYDCDTDEKTHELPFERTLISLNSKEYEFTDSELDLYCDGSSESSGSSHDNHDDLDKSSLSTEGERYALFGSGILMNIQQEILVNLSNHMLQ